MPPFPVPSAAAPQEEGQDEGRGWRCVLSPQMALTWVGQLFGLLESVTTWSLLQLPSTLGARKILLIKAGVAMARRDLGWVCGSAQT